MAIKKPRISVSDKKFDLGPVSGDKAGVYPTVIGDVSDIVEQVRGDYMREEGISPDESGKFSFGRGPNPTGDTGNDFIQGPDTDPTFAVVKSNESNIADAEATLIAAELSRASASDTVPTAQALDSRGKHDTLPGLLAVRESEPTGDHPSLPPESTLDYIIQNNGPWYREMDDLQHKVLLLEDLMMLPGLDVDLENEFDLAIEYYLEEKRISISSNKVRWVGDFDELSEVISSTYPIVMYSGGNSGRSLSHDFDLKRSRMVKFSEENISSQICKFSEDDIDESYCSPALELVFLGGKAINFGVKRPIDIFKDDEYFDHIPTLDQLIEMIGQLGSRFDRFFGYIHGNNLLTRTIILNNNVHEVACVTVRRDGKLRIRPYEVNDETPGLTLLPFY